MLVHQKAAEGNFKLTDGLVPHLRLPATMEDWHWAMQLNQAQAITTATDWFLSLAPRCAGSIVWQLNDCWPVTSWAAVDGDERAKPMLFALRDAHAPRRVLLQPADPARPDAGLVVVVANHSAAPWEGEVAIDRLDLGGRVLASESIQVSLQPRATSTTELSAVVARAADESREVVRAALDDARGLWFFAEYRDSALDAGRYRASWSDDGTQGRLEITAETLLRDVTLLVDKIDPSATVDRALVTLLPGESASFTVQTSKRLTVEEVTHPSVLRTANQLVARDPDAVISPHPVQ